MPIKGERTLRVVRYGDSLDVDSLDGGDCFLFDFAQGMADNEVLERKEDNGTTVYQISERWQIISGDFGQQVLNRLVVARILKCGASSVRVEWVGGATVDIIRVAALLGLEVLIVLPSDAVLPDPDERGAAWLRDAFRLASALLPSVTFTERSVLLNTYPELVRLRDSVRVLDKAPRGHVGNGYAAYAFSQRDQALIYEMQKWHVGFYPAGAHVLDVGCGTGIFLEALVRAGLGAVGVEQDTLSARYAKGLGHTVFESSGIEFLEQTALRFNGVYCSHFVEHLPFEVVGRLVAGIVRVLEPGGVAVFVFPDPESIRSQLLGFWRDPEHVRFYHPDLIEMVCAIHALDCEYSSQRIPGRKVVSFSLAPPWCERPGDDEAGAFGVSQPSSFVQRWLARLGLATRGDLHVLKERADRHDLRERELREAIMKLWEVNQTWAWEDNVVLSFRKRAI